MYFLTLPVLVFGLLGLAGFAHADEDESPRNVPQAINVETLLTAGLEGIDGREILVSRVTLPPHASLPKHWHPGEEFAYVLEGTVTLWQEGKADIVSNRGEVVKIPLKQIHAARAGAEGATILVFRVHEQGQPERVPVD